MYTHEQQDKAHGEVCNNIFCRTRKKKARTIYKTHNENENELLNCCVIQMMNEKNSTDETNIIHKREKTKKMYEMKENHRPHTCLLSLLFYILSYLLFFIIFSRQTCLTHISIAEILLVHERSAQRIRLIEQHDQLPIITNLFCFFYILIFQLFVELIFMFV